jgi:hypothetical protein
VGSSSYGSYGTSIKSNGFTLNLGATIQGVIDMEGDYEDMNYEIGRNFAWRLSHPPGYQFLFY